MYGLLSTVDDSAPVSPGGVGVVPRWISMIAGRVDPPPQDFSVIILRRISLIQVHGWSGFLVV